MEPVVLIAALLVAAIVIVAAVTLNGALTRRAERRASRDDLARAGEDADAASAHPGRRDATRRAEGSTAWTRIGGGGGA